MLGVRTGGARTKVAWRLWRGNAAGGTAAGLAVGTLGLVWYAARAIRRALGVDVRDQDPA
jgi:hypothetical protein